MYYILDDFGNSIETKDVTVWAEFFKDVEKRTLALDNIKSMFQVSTVFLRLEHGEDSDGNPLLWETMVFGSDEEECIRAASKEDAELNHQNMVSKYTAMT